MDKPILTINPDRIELDEAYMQMAEIWAKRSKANRLQVGALLVSGQQIISDGYNGMPSGTADNEEVCERVVANINPATQGDPFGETTYTTTTKSEVLHAEANTILKLAANGGASSHGATLYTTYSPCPECAKLIKQAKIARVVYRNTYRRPEGVELLTKWGVQCDQLKAPFHPAGEITQALRSAENVAEKPLSTQYLREELARQTAPVRGAFETEPPMIVADEPIQATNLAEPPTLTEEINAAGEPVLRSVRPGRILLKYQGIKYGQNFGFGVGGTAGEEVFILNQETVYSKGDGYWGSWEQGTYFEAEVTTSHLCVRIYRKLTETQHFPRHDWKSDGLGGGHNGEYYYTCARCGEHDWIAGYGTTTDLRDGPCIVKQRPEGQRGPLMIGEEGVELNPDGSTGASGFG